jgi:hypothetical protein
MTLRSVARPHLPFVLANWPPLEEVGSSVATSTSVLLTMERMVIKAGTGGEFVMTDLHANNGAALSFMPGGGVNGMPCPDKVCCDSWAAERDEYLQNLVLAGPIIVGAGAEASDALLNLQGVRVLANLSPAVAITSSMALGKFLDPAAPIKAGGLFLLRLPDGAHAFALFHGKPERNWALFAPILHSVIHRGLEAARTIKERCAVQGAVRELETIAFALTCAQHSKDRFEDLRKLHSSFKCISEHSVAAIATVMSKNGGKASIARDGFVIATFSMRPARMPRRALVVAGSLRCVH